MPPLAPRLRPLEDRALPAPAYQTLPVLPDITATMQLGLKDVAALGRSLGNRADVVAKAGDSITANWSSFLIPMGKPGYNPVASGLAAVRPDLVPVWQAYLAPVDALGNNSYTRTSLSAYPGWTSDAVRDTAAKEVQAIHPAVAFVMAGTNDSIHSDIDRYERNLRSITRTYLDLGVVPVLTTIPDNNTAGDAFQPWTDAANQVVADTAEEFGVPLWNYWRSIQGLPFEGLSDGVHPNASPLGGGFFGPGGLAFGGNVRNLAALEILQKLRAEVLGDAPADDAAGPTPTAWQPLASGEPVAATGAPVGYAPVVRLTDPASGASRGQFLAYDARFTGGVRVAVGDVNGDGVSDVVTSPGAGGGPNVKAFSGVDGSELLSFFAFEPTFTGGVSLAVGDANGDGKADIVVGAGAGGGPRVRVIRAADRAPLADFLAFEPTFAGGVNVAVGDFGVAVGPGVGGGGLVKLFDASGRERLVLPAFEAGFRGGVSVAAGDVDGDGKDDLAFAPAAGGTRVRVVTPTGGELASFYAGGLDRAGVRLAVVPAARGRRGVVVTGTADWQGAVSGFDAAGARLWRAEGSNESWLSGGPFVG